MIVITTTVPLNYWYSYKTNSNDTLSQLYRRIGFYVMIAEDEITVYEEIGNDGRPKGKGKFYKNELVKKAREERKKQISLRSSIRFVKNRK